MAVVYTVNGWSKLWPMKTHTIIMMMTLLVAGLVIGCGQSIGEDVENYTVGNCIDCDLRGADLTDHSRTPLIGASLSGADLSGADMSGRELLGVDLSDANLNDANLSGVKLFKTNFGGANKKGVDLSGSTDWYLYGHEQGIDLTGVDLRGAEMWAASLDGVNLTDVNFEGNDMHEAYLNGAIL